MPRKHPRPTDKLKAQQWARDLLYGKAYIIDTETTGLSKTAEIVQVGIVNGAGEVVLNTLVKPTKRFPKEVIQVHGITNQMVADAPTFDDLYVQLSVLLAGVPLVAYNMDFDWRMIEQTTALYQLPLMRTGTRSCAMKKYAMYWGDWNEQKRSYRWQKLSMAAKQQRIKVENAHDAVGDCLMTQQLIEKMAK